MGLFAALKTDNDLAQKLIHISRNVRVALLACTPIAVTNLTSFKATTCQIVEEQGQNATLLPCFTRAFQEWGQSIMIELFDDITKSSSVFNLSVRRTNRSLKQIVNANMAIISFFIKWWSTKVFVNMVWTLANDSAQADNANSTSHIKKRKQQMNF